MTDKEAIDNIEKYIDLILNKKCYNFNVAVAIKHLIKRCKELEQIEEAHHKLNGQLRKELQLKDKIVMDIVKRLDNDIKNITETKADGYTDDYRRCRLKAYRTKTREIKEYIVKEYFTKKASEK